MKISRDFHIWLWRCLRSKFSLCSMVLPYMVIQLPYKEMAKTKNPNISKTTHRNSKIFSGMIFLVNIFHFMQKKVGVKKMSPFSWLCAFKRKLHKFCVPSLRCCWTFGVTVLCFLSPDLQWIKKSKSGSLWSGSLKLGSH